VEVSQVLLKLRLALGLIHFIKTLIMCISQSSIKSKMCSEGHESRLAVEMSFSGTHPLSREIVVMLGYVLVKAQRKNLYRRVDHLVNNVDLEAVE
jgi:hypothetical protein